MSRISVSRQTAYAVSCTRAEAWLVRFGRQSYVLGAKRQNTGGLFLAKKREFGDFMAIFGPHGRRARKADAISVSERLGCCAQKRTTVRRPSQRAAQGVAPRCDKPRTAVHRKNQFNSHENAMQNCTKAYRVCNNRRFFSHLFGYVAELSLLCTPKNEK